MKTSNKIFKSCLFLFSFVFTVFSIVSMFHGFFDIPTAIAGPSLATIAISSLSIDDMDFTEGTENMGGFGSVVYIGLRSQIDTYPVEAAHTNLDSLVHLVGDYAFIATKHFLVCDCVPESVGFSPESQGEFPGGQSFKLKGEFFVPNSAPKGRGLARLLNNSYGVVILTNDDGTRLSAGTQQHACKFKATYERGMKAADKSGVKVQWECDSFVPGYQYEGVIEIDGSTLPAVS